MFACIFLLGPNHLLEFEALYHESLMSVCLQWKRRFQLQLLKLVLGEGEVAYFECLTFQRVCHNQN